MTRELPTSLLMFIAARAAADRIFSAVHDAGFDDVTIAQSRLLMGIDEQGTRLSVLADRAQIAKQTATALVDQAGAGRLRRARARPLRREGTPVRMTPRAKAAMPSRAPRRRGSRPSGRRTSAPTG